MLKPLPPDPAVTKIGNSSKRRRAVAYTVEDLLSVLHPHCPVKIDALWTNRRRVEHGLTTVGLKIHCLGDNRELLNLIEALCGRSEVIANRFYAHARASVTLILPAVG